MVQREIDEPNVFLLGRIDQVLTKVIDGGVAFVIRTLGQLSPVEKGMLFGKIAIAHH